MRKVLKENRLITPRVFEAVWRDEDGRGHRVWIEEPSEEEAKIMANTLACGSRVHVYEQRAAA